MTVWLSGNGVAHINEVLLHVHLTESALRWVNIHRFILSLSATLNLAKNPQVVRINSENRFMGNNRKINGELCITVGLLPGLSGLVC